MHRRFEVNTLINRDAVECFRTASRILSSLSLSRLLFSTHNRFKVLLKRYYLQFEFQFKIEALQLDVQHR